LKLVTAGSQTFFSNAGFERPSHRKFIFKLLAFHTASFAISFIKAVKHPAYFSQFKLVQENFIAFLKLATERSTKSQQCVSGGLFFI